MVGDRNAAWTVETLNETVADELRALPRDMRLRFDYIAGIIRSEGFANIKMPHVRHLDGDLWEMRLRGRDGIARAIYVTVRHRRVVILRVFIKKTQRIPRREIELALQRAQEVLE